MNEFIAKYRDKIDHATVGYIIATVLPISPVYALFVAFIVGIAKEVYDYKHPKAHTTDTMDVLATWLGASAGFLAIVIK